MSKVTRISQQKTYIQNATLALVLAISITMINYAPDYQARIGKISFELKDVSFERIRDYRVMLEKQAAIGEYIEANIEQPSIFLAPYELMNFLPGLSSKSKVVFFRGSIFTPHRVNLDDIENVLTSNRDFPIKWRMKVLDKYRIQYLLFEDTSVKEYYSAYPEFFKWENLGSHWLIEYTKMSED